MKKLGISITLIILVDALLSTYFHRSNTLISTKSSKVSSYSNQANNDNHKLSHSSDTLKFAYFLDSSAQWPVAGIRFEPIKPITIKSNDNIKFTAQSLSKETKEQKIIFVLWAKPMESTTADEGNIPEIPLYIKTTLKDKTQHFSLAKSDFYIPVWWLDKQKIDLNEIPNPNLNEIHALGIRSGYAPVKNFNHQLSIHSLEIHSTNSWIYYSQAIILLLTIIIYLFYKKRQPTLLIPIKGVLEPKKFNNNNTLIIILDTIRKNSDNPLLTLFDLEQITKIPENQISKLIKNEFQMSFKQYLNTVRISIATELLKETSLSIKEIVSKSGYQTSSHFFRVFKASTGQSPTEFRTSSRNKH